MQVGLRGPAPKPTILKLLNGNAGQYPLPRNEPRPQTSKPLCPSWLDKLGKAEWHRVAPELYRMGLLTKVDQDALALYCDAWSQYLSARARVKEGGQTYRIGTDGEIRTRPETHLLAKLQGQLRGWAREFGLTPSARGQMNIPGASDEGDDLLD